jgi:acyl carrier protein phosphodiesterase
MNFLAHIYLSGDNVDVRMGNLIGDFVKGRSLGRYPDGVQKGIFLHRAIDFYTDTHPATFEVRQLFRQGYRKYAGVVVDVFFDHFLARYWGTFSPYPLRGFTRKFYYQMALNYHYSYIRDQFLIFFPDIIDFVKVDYNIVPAGWKEDLVQTGAVELKENKKENSK